MKQINLLLQYMNLLFLFLFFLLFLSFYYLNHSIEPFHNYPSCSNLFSQNSFCQYDTNDKKCKCKYQKDDVRVAFDSSPACCDRICSRYSKDECLKFSNEDKNTKYYCNIGGNCIEYQGTIVSSHISANNCGVDPLNNQLILPYESIEKCQKTVTVCDQYNDPQKSRLQNKEACLANSNCGYCTSANGEGKCIEGTASEPLDLQKYYYCSAYSGEKDYVYQYGNRADYILQKPDGGISSVNGENPDL